MGLRAWVLSPALETPGHPLSPGCLLFKACATTKSFLKPIHNGFKCKDSVGSLPSRDGVYN